MIKVVQHEIGSFSWVRSLINGSVSPMKLHESLKIKNLTQLWSEGDVTMKEWSERCYVTHLEYRAGDPGTKEVG